MNPACPCALPLVGKVAAPSLTPSWFDFANLPPRNPLELISFASINGITGIPENNAALTDPTLQWTGPANVLPTGPAVCSARGTDNQERVADAAQWNFQHRTWFETANIAYPTQKILVLRGGREWKMTVPLLADCDVQDVLLTYRNNLVTRGDAQGTIPVLRFANVNNQQLSLIVTLAGGGIHDMVFITITDNDWFAADAEWHIY